MMAAPSQAQVVAPDAPEEAFGEFSYYDAYPRRDPDDLIDQAAWVNCWAVTDTERARLAEAAQNAPPELQEELQLAAAHYQVAAIYYSELVRGTNIYLGVSTRQTNDALEIERQGLIGGAPQWIAGNAADCIRRMPDSAMPEFAELFPWLAGGLGTFYSQ